MLNFKPLLAYTVENFEKLKYPLMASPKLDGIRLTFSEVAEMRTRSLKPLPNRRLNDIFNNNRLMQNLDGEVLIGDPSAHDVYRTTVSHVMSEDKDPAGAVIHVFDYIDLNLPFHKRYAMAEKAVKAASEANLPVQLVQHQLIQNAQALADYESLVVGEHGYEGVMVRDPEGRYKCGRASARSGELGKVKRYLDDEATIVSFEERMHNANDAFKNELGRTARSTNQENLEGMNTLGALIVEHPTWGRFRIGTGFDAATAQKIWDHQDDYAFKLAKFKYFPVGMKDKPRHPVFLGLRDERDMSK